MFMILKSNCAKQIASNHILARTVSAALTSHQGDDGDNLPTHVAESRRHVLQPGDIRVLEPFEHRPCDRTKVLRGVLEIRF